MYYMVRAMSQSLAEFDVFFKKSVIAVGWSKVNFSSISDPEQVVKKAAEVYYSNTQAAQQVVGKKRNEIRRFKRIQSGDRILVPYWSAVRLAKDTGTELYDEADASKHDLGNQRRVDYLKDASGDILTIARDQLSEGLQRRLRVRGSTISDLSDFTKELDDLFTGQSYQVTIDSASENLKKTFKDKLLQLLRDGSSTLQAGGRGLELLIRELLEADGYRAVVQSKNRFSDFADADIEAIRDDHTWPIKLLVQVKHHRGLTDDWGAKQLTRVLETEPDLFAEYKLVLITTGDPSPELKNFCNDRDDVSLMSGTDLVDWITDSLHMLCSETRRKLRISEVPYIIDMKS